MQKGEGKFAISANKHWWETHRVITFLYAHDWFC